MKKLVDLSHIFEDGMPGFSMRQENGTSAEFTASVRPFLTHQQSLPFYNGKASFEITEISFQTSIGTYLDSPSHRFEGKRDIAQLTLEELVLDAVVINVSDPRPSTAVDLCDVDLPDDLAGKAVLFKFGYDEYWGQERYSLYPFIGRDLIGKLVELNVKLVGVDTFNIDSQNDPERPAHTELLSRDILVVENLCNLSQLPAVEFRFFAIPIKAKNTAAITIRAFAEVDL